MSFTDILNLSISASWLILALVLIRPLVKGKAIRCALWALVAIRLLCPVSIESELSLLPTRELIPRDYLVMEPQNVEDSAPATLDIITNPIYDTQVSIEVAPSIDRLQTWELFCSILWLAGMGVMIIYAAYSYLSLRLRVRMAAWIGGRVWECDEIDSPFILGLLRPRIYLPSALDEETRDLVLAHERSHLSRLDHLWKPLGFGLLTVHWFNPILWLAYVLLCRDIELACDERVVKIMDKSRILAYSDALIRCTVPHRTIALCPLAFGEVGVKSRIKAILHYKKPGFWVMLTAMILSIILAVGFLTDPAIEPPGIEVFLNQGNCRIHSLTSETITLEIHRSDLPDNVLDGRKHRFQGSPPLLLEYGDTSLYLSEAVMRGNEVILTVTFEHKPDDSGALLLPYNPNSVNSDATVCMGYWDTAESGAVLGGTIRIHESDTDFLSVAIQADRWNRTKDSLQFQLDGLNRLEYSLEPQQIPETGQSILSDTNLLYRATELHAFTAPEFQLNTDGTFTMIPNAFSSYHGHGTYTNVNGELEMRTEDGRYIYVFTTEDKGELVYDQSRSSDIQYYIDARTAANLPDGTRFFVSVTEESPKDDVTEGEIEELLNIIRYAPLHTFNPYDYITAHQPEYDRLVSLGNHTVQYCFTQFAKGGQTDLKGSIMAIACREILGLTDDFSVDTYHNNGQDWYDAYILSTETEALWREMEELEWIYQSERQKSIETE